MNIHRSLPVFITLGVLLGLFTGCGSGKRSEIPADTEDSGLHAFLDSVYMDGLNNDPETATQRGYKIGYGKWTDISDAHWESELKRMETARDEMKRRFGKLPLTPSETLSMRLFEYEVRRMRDRYPFRQYSYPVEQMHGMQAGIPAFLINFHSVDSLSDAEAYISRLKGIDMLIDQLITKLRTRAGLGIIPPKFVFPMVKNDCQGVISGYPFEADKPDCPLLADFRKKVEGLSLETEASEDLIKQAEDALNGAVMSGYSRLIAYLDTLETQADDRDGVWKFPNGGAFYEYRLRFITTTSLGPDEIHQLGLDEVARIQAEMDTIRKKVGFAGNLKAFMDSMRVDPRFYFENTASGKQAYLDSATAIIDAMREKLPDMFNTLPKAQLEVRAVEAFREQSAGKAFYEVASPDGTRPGVYYANLYDMAAMPTYQMEALAYHEAIPGHHMQLSIAQELEDVPMFRQFGHYTAYVEGWGLYSEWLPREFGCYSDPYSDFGRLAMELWRACRLVVDTGIHHKKWTREQAIQYLLDNTPNPEGDCRKAIERYIVMPGQATAYKIGMLRIIELRRKAENALGEKFDLKGFHDLVLKGGALPLDILEEQVDEWIREQQNPAPQS